MLVLVEDESDLEWDEVWEEEEWFDNWDEVKKNQDHFESIFGSTDTLMAHITAKDVFDKAKENDPLGLFVLNMVSEYLAKALASLAVVVDCECFYIGGGVSKCGSILTDCIKKYYDKYSFYATKNTKIKLAKLGNDAGMIGASYL